MTLPHFNYFVIGGGSGGVASARRATTYGAKVAIAEGLKWGGTCVNVGCVPKKMMWWCASVKETLRDCNHYGFHCNESPSFSWSKMKEARNRSITRLNGIYSNNLSTAGITTYNAKASFLGQENGLFKLQVGDDCVMAEKVLIATGSEPITLPNPGGHLCMNSDDFFSLETQPKKVAVIGAGYIAVELASVFTILGSHTHLFTRGAIPLRKFDEMLGNELQREMNHQGCIMHTHSEIKSITRDAPTGLLTINLENEESFGGFDSVLSAIGRSPCIKNLGLNTLSEKFSLTSQGHIVVDEYQNTSIHNIFALGDVCGKVELTPMAISAGRRLADRLFGGILDAKADYENVPTVIFTHPPIGTIGLSEIDAKQFYGEENIKIYKSTSINLYYNAFNIPPSDKPKIQMKLVCLLPNEKILGMHIIGMGADEMLQGFGVAIKMGATKKDLDRCIAIHPTAAEEMVTLPPWGL